MTESPIIPKEKLSNEDYIALYLSPISGDAISQTNPTVRIENTQPTTTAFYGLMFREDIASSFVSLDEIYRECSEEGWDGYNSKPLMKEAYLLANKLLHNLPPFFPAPEIIAEPEGGIGFEWYKEKGYSLILSIRNEQNLIYAGTFGDASEVSGTERYGESLPELILFLLKRLYPSK
ncbi:MAG: hypothetical protein CVU57_16255 [Deltaproteobacteria bacterium HGW-Deltaproteobacteria-15]|jgi:hypothetical protein|nr:MAG: hypothetical protein CVU57_16255 [Deltaproteobacteria bacterium HGW-Deltaproteobacteria-15]